MPSVVDLSVCSEVAGLASLHLLNFNVGTGFRSIIDASLHNQEVLLAILYNFFPL